jgi:hypothetical protein
MKHETYQIRIKPEVRALWEKSGKEQGFACLANFIKWAVNKACGSK